MKVEDYTMTNEQMIDVLSKNYPASENTMLTEAIDRSIDLLEKEKEYNQQEAIKFIQNKTKNCSKAGVLGVSFNDRHLNIILELEKEYKNGITN